MFPSDEKLAQKIMLENRKYNVIHNVLHFEPDSAPWNYCLVVPASLHEVVKLQEAPAGCVVADHFAFKKVYDCLCQYYWWKRMRADIHHHCRSCLVCAAAAGRDLEISIPTYSHPSRRPIPLSGSRCVAVATDGKRESKQRGWTCLQFQTSALKPL